MKSKTSFFNRGIILDDVRRFGWISIAYGLVLFFLMPLQILMIHSSKEFYQGQFKETINGMFYFRNTVSHSFAALAMSVLLAIFLFRYLQVKNSTDMIHSLPIKRSTLYRSHAAFGIVSMIVPVLVIGVITIFLNKSLDMEQYYRIYDVIHWVGITVLFDLLFFLTTVFVGMIVGSSVLQGILTFIFLFLPVGIVILMSENLKIFVYGYMFNIGNGTNKLSPIVRLFQGFRDYNNIYNKLSLSEIVVYVILCIALYFLGKFLYNKRNLEAVNHSIAFKGLEYVFKYGAAFCSMLIGGIYFQQTDKNIYWILFGFLVASFIGYFIAEMVIKKSIWVFKGIKGYGIFAAIMIVVMLGLKFDIVGYERKLPSLEQIDNVYFTEDYYGLKNIDYDNAVKPNEKYLKSTYNFHKKLIEDKEKNKHITDKDLNFANFIYKLKDGSTLKRAYRISTRDYNDYLKPIYESKEFKKTRYPIFSINSSDIKKIYINPSYQIKQSKSITDPKDIKEVVEILRQDINNESYEDMSFKRRPWGNLDLTMNFDSVDKYKNLPGVNINRDELRINFTWNKSHKLFEEWLKKKGYLEDVRVLPKDISYAVVEKIDNNNQWEEKEKSGKYISGGKVKRLEITDKNQIETCLQNYKYGRDSETVKYVIGFYGLNKKDIDFGYFDENSAPDFVKEYFK